MPAYAKAIAAAIGAGITAAISYYPHASWIPIAAALCTVLATYAMPNVPKNSEQNMAAAVPAKVAETAPQEVLPESPIIYYPNYYTPETKHLPDFNERVGL